MNTQQKDKDAKGTLRSEVQEQKGQDTLWFV